MKSEHWALAALAAGMAVLIACSAPTGERSAEADAVMAPRFEVDPLWPKPLPNHWLLGTVIGVDVDDEDNVWIVHRGSSLDTKELYATWDPPASSCCYAAPPVLVFNQAGELVEHWGGSGEGYDWPASNHGIDVDHKGNVWIGGNGRGASRAEAALPHDESAMGQGRVHDSMVLKFSKSGQFLMQLGKPFMGEGSHDLVNFKLPAKTLVDPKTNELYVADGYGNRRVIVLDADTGEYKRHWGAYGNEPDDTQLPAYKPGEPVPQQFRTPVHGIALSDDGMVYVCDRTTDRIQVFKTDGTYVHETWIEPNTLGDGSTFDVALSRDPEQKYLYVADGSNQRIHILDRESLELLTSFGDGGRQPGQFYAVHSIASDSMGNLYTTETYDGQRVQRFEYKGLAPVAEKQQGVVWPSD
jgi:DNA-binding beta-propeller fold protein YncE